MVGHCLPVAVHLQRARLMIWYREEDVREWEEEEEKWWFFGFARRVRRCWPLWRRQKAAFRCAKTLRSGRNWIRGTAQWRRRNIPGSGLFIRCFLQDSLHLNCSRTKIYIWIFKIENKIIYRSTGIWENWQTLKKTYPICKYTTEQWADL